MLERVRFHTRFAIRSLRRSPSFTVIGALIIALGVASATAVFAVLSATFLRPLPYVEPDRLIAVSETRRGEEISVSFSNFLDWRAQNHSFTELAAFVGRAMALTAPGTTPERIRAQLVTSSLFPTLGVAPARGRGFLKSEDNPGSPHVAVVSDGLWHRAFGADPAIVGRTVVLNREPYLVVGVMPPGFDFPGGLVFGPADVWLPAGLFALEDRTNRQSHPGLAVIGRLRLGATLTSARADLDAIARRLREEYPASNHDQGVLLRTALDAIVGDMRPALALVGGAVGLLLLITCANVAGLVLARTLSRHREVAIRLALGASRLRVISQLVLESVVVATLGGAVGVFGAWWGLRAASPLLEGFPRLTDVPLDWRVISFAVGATLLTSVLCGVGPALAATAGSLDGWLRERGRSAAMGAWSRQALVAAEIALSVMLVVGATLLGRSFAKLRAATGGIDPSGVLTFDVQLPDGTYPDRSAVQRFYMTLVERLAALPGVSAVGGISSLPFSGGGSQSGITALGGTDEQRTDVAVVTPEYFRAMGVELVRGRVFTTSDDSVSPPVAVVDERLVQRFWPGADPIGKRLAGWGFRELTVVGVVRHVSNYGVAAVSREEMFVPHAQRPSQRLSVVARSIGDPNALVPSVRRLVGELDAALPVYNVRPMSAVVAKTITAPRLSATVSTVVALVALVLAGVGLYGVLAFTVSQRRHEIGVRMALGAPASAVGRLIVKQGMMLAIGGVLVGGAGSLAVVQFVRAQLFGVKPVDVPTVIITGGLFIGITILASWLPARRAAAVSPLTALRAE